MAESLPLPKTDVGTHARSQRVGDRALALESDLSCDMPIADEEVDAITRLLGEFLEKLLASSQST